MRENRPQKCYACDAAKVSCYVGLIPPPKKRRKKRRRKRRRRTLEGPNELSLNNTLQTRTAFAVVLHFDVSHLATRRSPHLTRVGKRGPNAGGSHIVALIISHELA